MLAPPVVTDPLLAATACFPSVMSDSSTETAVDHELRGTHRYPSFVPDL